MNRATYDYIRDRDLYSIEGLEAVFRQADELEFPPDCPGDQGPLGPHQGGRQAPLPLAEHPKRRAARCNSGGSSPCTSSPGTSPTGSGATSSMWITSVPPSNTRGTPPHAATTRRPARRSTSGDAGYQVGDHATTRRADRFRRCARPADDPGQHADRARVPAGVVVHHLPLPGHGRPPLGTPRPARLADQHASAELVDQPGARVRRSVRPTRVVRRRLRCRVAICRRTSCGRRHSGR